MWGMIFDKISDSDKKRKPSGNTKNRHNTAGPARRRLAVEPLEDRCLLSAVGFDTPSVHNFSPTADSTTGLTLDLSTSRYMQLVDMNGDGIDDVVAESDGRLYLFKGKGNGVFDARVAMDTGNVLGNVDNYYLHVAKVTSDNVPDLIVIEKTRAFDGNQIVVYPGVLSGSNVTFSFTGSMVRRIPVTTSTLVNGGKLNELGFSVTGAQFADVNNDGKIDVIMSLFPINTTGNTGAMVSYTGFLTAAQSTGTTITALTPTELKLNGSTAISESLYGIGSASGQNRVITRASEASNSDFKVYSFNTTGTLSSVTAVPNASVFHFHLGSGAIYRPVVANVPTSANTTSLSMISAISYTKGGAVQNALKIVDIASSTSRIVDVDIQPVYVTVGQLYGAASTPTEIIISNGYQTQVVHWNNGQLEKRTLQTGDAAYHSCTIINGNVVAVGETRLMYFAGGDMTKPIKLADLATFDRYGKTDESSQAVFGDFNGDGFIDIAILHASGKTVTIYQGKNSNGSLFEKTVTLAVIDGVALITGKFTSKYTSSSQVDLAVLQSGSTSESKAIRVYAFNTNTSIGVLKSVDTNISASRAVAMAVGDISGAGENASPDGFDDIVTANSYSASVSIFRNTGNGQFASTGQTIILANDNVSSGSGNITAVAIADVDKDGQLDIVALNTGFRKSNASAYGEVIVVRQLTLGSFPLTSFGYYAVGGDGQSAGALIVADLNGDAAKLPDILVGPTSSSTDTFLLFQNNPNTQGTFGAVSATPIPVGSLSTFQKSHLGVAIGKVDGNSSPDLIVAAGNSIRKLLNKATFVEVGTATLLVRNYDTSATASFSTASGQSRSWVDEWSSFYIELWVKPTIAGEKIVEFKDCSISFNNTLFTITTANVQGVNGMTITNPTLNSAKNQLTFSGSSINGVGGGSDYVLLARVLCRPATKTTDTPSPGIKLPTDKGYAQGQAAGFSVSPSVGITTLSGSTRKSGSTSLAMPSMTVWPVIYDLNDDGAVNLTDFSTFIKSFGKNVNTVPSAKACHFTHSASTTVGLADFSQFIKAFGGSLTVATGATVPSNYIKYVANFPTPWLPAAAPMAASMMADMTDEWGNLSTAVTDTMVLPKTEHIAMTGSDIQNPSLHVVPFWAAIKTGSSDGVPFQSSFLSYYEYTSHRYGDLSVGDVATYYHQNSQSQNSVGSSVDCPVRPFRTENHGQFAEMSTLESFDRTTRDRLLLSWSLPNEEVDVLFPALK